MRLKINALLLETVTEKGLFGTRLEFSDGLNVLHAVNTTGKSTCINSILYALGLEGMLSASRSVPLPPSLTEQLLHGSDVVQVRESYVTLEIENAQGDAVTVTRRISSVRKQTEIVHVRTGRQLTRKDGGSKVADYLVRVAGAAQSERGFHQFLAKFLGLTIPLVQRHDGTQAPLYLEILFPYFFVDQQSGWRDIKARMPTYLQIPEMSKRSAEYVLGLDILTRSIRRQELVEQKKHFEQQWSRVLRQAGLMARGIGFVVRGIPATPPTTWPVHPAPMLYISDGESWRSLDDELRLRQDEIQELLLDTAKNTVPPPKETVLEIERLEAELSRFEATQEQTDLEVRAERSQYDLIVRRLDALRDDLRQHKDEQRLRERGALATIRVASDVCPTCDQPVSGALLPQNIGTQVMSIDENVRFLHDQVSAFERLRVESSEVLGAKEQKLVSATAAVRRIATELREVKASLASPTGSVSTAAIERRIRLEDYVRRLTALQAEFLDLLESFRAIAEDYGAVILQLKNLEDLSLSEADRSKIKDWGSRLRDQLEEYGFRSFRVEDIGISYDTYRPAQGPYDLGFTSASDAIRVVWAYLIGCLELARNYSTNHLNFLVLDEPKQQSASDLSYAALLRRAAEAKHYNQQVIIATSQDEASMGEMLSALDARHIYIEDRLLKPLIASR